MMVDEALQAVGLPLLRTELSHGEMHRWPPGQRSLAIYEWWQSHRSVSSFVCGAKTLNPQRFTTLESYEEVEGLEMLCDHGDENSWEGL